MKKNKKIIKGEKNKDHEKNYFSCWNNALEQAKIA